jgi:hypothetical protein
MAFKLLDAATGTGASASLALRKIVEGHTVQINITGSPTAVTVDIEGSLDNSNWSRVLTSAMSAAELTAGTSIAHVEDKPVRFVRLNLITLTGGTSPTVTALYEGLEHRD